MKVKFIGENHEDANLDYGVFLDGSRIGTLEVCFCKTWNHAARWTFCNKLRKRFGLEPKSVLIPYHQYSSTFFCRDLKRLTRHMIEHQIVLTSPPESHSEDLTNMARHLRIQHDQKLAWKGPKKR